MLIFVVAFSLAATGLIYFGSHSSSGKAVVVVYATALCYLLVCGVVGIWFLARCIRREIHQSPLFLLSAVILATLPWTGWYGIFGIDWSRFQKDRAFYEEAVASGGSSKVHVFDWGEAGFMGMNGFHFLVFDRSGQIMSPPEQRPESWNQMIAHPDPSRETMNHEILREPKCVTSASRLTGDFYSVATIC